MRNGHVVGEEAAVGVGVRGQALHVGLLESRGVVGVLQHDDEEVVERGACRNSRCQVR